MCGRGPSTPWLPFLSTPHRHGTLRALLRSSEQTWALSVLLIFLCPRLPWHQDFGLLRPVVNPPCFSSLRHPASCCCRSHHAGVSWRPGFPDPTADAGLLDLTHWSINLGYLGFSEVETALWNPPPRQPSSPPSPAQPRWVSVHLPISTSRVLHQPKPTRTDSWLVVISFFTLRPLFFQGSRHCEVLRAWVAHTPAGLSMEPVRTTQGCLTGKPHLPMTARTFRMTGLLVLGFS